MINCGQRVICSRFIAKIDPDRGTKAGNGTGAINGFNNYQHSPLNNMTAEPSRDVLKSDELVSC